MEKRFIVTSNEDTAFLLEQSGFNLITKQDGKFYFVNNNKIVCTNLKDIAYTNILTF